jgi:hypothetical protein
MRIGFSICSMIAIVGLSAFPLDARAGQVIVSSLGDPIGAFSPSQVDTADFFAQEFTTGGSFTLQSIVAQLGDLNSGNNGDFTVTAQVVSVTSEGNSPGQGTILATLTQNGAIPTSGFSNVEFDATSTVSLSPTNFYWFVLSASSSDGSGSVQWQFTDSFATTGPGTLPNIAFFSSGMWGSPLAESPFLIQVNAVGGAVPEPSSLVMGCAGFAAALFARRRIKSRNAA